jgi:hypothetical protein
MTPDGPWIGPKAPSLHRLKGPVICRRERLPFACQPTVSCEPGQSRAHAIACAIACIKSSWEGGGPTPRVAYRLALTLRREPPRRQTGRRPVPIGDVIEAANPTGNRRHTPVEDGTKRRAHIHEQENGTIAARNGFLPLRRALRQYVSSIGSRFLPAPQPPQAGPIARAAW